MTSAMLIMDAESSPWPDSPGSRVGLESLSSPLDPQVAEDVVTMSHDVLSCRNDTDRVRHGEDDETPCDSTRQENSWCAQRVPPV
jgi:hypothetical protein